MLSNQMPPTARVWVYQANRLFTDAEKEIIKKETESFLHTWTSHQSDLPASYELKYDLFLVLMADEAEVQAGGCSIDKSVHFIQSLGEKINMNFMNRLLFAYKDESTIKTAPRKEFEKLVADGIIRDETIVFNNLVGTKAEFDKQWEIPFYHSWHKQLI